MWFEMELHDVCEVLLSLKGLLFVLWHMDNPTRNQSLHSYCSNRWANMFPGGCPYYSGATGPPGDNRARWNRGVVTTEWTGNELLQDKWDTTWEPRKSSIKSRGEWQQPLVEPLALYVFCIYILFVEKWHKNPLRFRQRHNLNLFGR